MPRPGGRPPVGVTGRPASREQAALPGDRGRFRPAARPELAEAAGTGLVPFLLEGVAQQSAWMQADGIHPVAEAQERILENVWQRLRPLL